jgi:hypothetical protein
MSDRVERPAVLREGRGFEPRPLRKKIGSKAYFFYLESETAGFSRRFLCGIINIIGNIKIFYVERN